MAVFVEDPDERVRLMGTELESALHSGRPARIEPALRVRVNHELFYFADTTEVRSFLADPPKYCGAITDPVFEGRFVPEQTSPRLVHDGTIYYFPDSETRAIFAAEPDSFATPKFHMMMPDSASGMM